jgi:hypothetical protein
MSNPALQHVKNFDAQPTKARRRPRRRGTQGFQLLEKLGFPWIFSSEISLFNGLHAIFDEKNFTRSKATFQKNPNAPTRARLHKAAFFSGGGARS